MGQQMYVHEGGLMSPWPKYKKANLIICFISISKLYWTTNWSCTFHTKTIIYLQIRKTSFKICEIIHIDIY